MMEGTVLLLTQIAGALLLVSVPSIILCRILMQFSPKDAPDGERKTQAVAVPSSGGIAIAILAFSLFLILHFYDDVLSSECSPQDAFECLPIAQRYAALKLWPHICLYLGAVSLGALDDRFALPAKLKFAILALISLGVAVYGQYVGGIFLPVADAYFPITAWLGIGGTALWLFVLMNATNFMDGSNGLAMGTLVIMIGGLLFGLPTAAEPFSDAAYIPQLTLFAILGFLYWNLQGKLYAGDAGSLFGGAVFASLGVYAARDGNIWLPATLALPFLVDVFMTLLWRAHQKHNLLTPHRHHAYQLFIRAGWSHIKTALLWWSLAAACAVTALWAASQSKSTSAYVFLILLGLGCSLWLFQRRHYGPKAQA